VHPRRDNDVSTRRVLIVDDDAGIGLLLENLLGAEGYETHTVGSAADALRAARETEFDVVLLDRWLPEVDAFDIIDAIRASAPGAALILLSASGDVSARVAGLRSGADDFIPKPFHVSEVIARIEAVLRRGAPGASDPDTLVYEDLRIDLAAHRVSRAGELIPLTPTELRVLRYLAENAERVLSRNQILEHVWQYDFGGRGEVVEKVVSNLRRKVDEGRVPLIQTVRGFGYCLRIEES
jgi:two-component system OmpR family response regulator